MNLLALITYPNFDPVIFHIGKLEIRWYGVAYLSGFLAGYWVLLRMCRRGEMRMPADWLGDLIGWLALGVVAGGRSGWWIFYHKNQGVPEPWWEPFAINHGGMSFHGGLTGVVVVLYIWSRIKKLPFSNQCDCVALVGPIGLFFGRIANFINGELAGRPTNVPWAMIFPKYDNQPRHPSQIYEALLEGPTLLALVWLTRRLRNRHDGQIAAMFVMGYAVIRFCVEFTREPDEQLGYILFGCITMGQILSVAIGLVGLVWWIRLITSKVPARHDAGK